MEVQPTLNIDPDLAAAQERNAALYASIDERNTAVSGTAQYLLDLRSRLHPEVELPQEDE